MKKPVQYSGELPTMKREKKVVLEQLIKLAREDPELHYLACDIYNRCYFHLEQSKSDIRIREYEIPFLLQPYIDKGYLSRVAIQRGSVRQIGYTVFPKKITYLEIILDNDCEKPLNH